VRGGWAVALALATCTSARHRLEGLACDAAHPCPGALYCDPTTSTCVAPEPGAPALALSFSAPFQGSIADASGHGNVVASRGVTWIADGKYGGAAHYDPAEGVFIEAGPSASLTFSTGFTLEAWVRPNFAQTHPRALVACGGPTPAYALYSYDAQVDAAPAAVVSTSAPVSVSGGAAIPLGVWTHLAATYDGAALRLYVNGVEESSAPATGPVSPCARPVRFGGSDQADWLDGDLDEVRLYPRALSAAELRADLARPISGG
jgi:hypothetical protein